MGVFSFRAGPTFRAADPREQLEAALDMPMSLSSTIGQQFKGGILESLGLGTAIRDVSLPEEGPATPQLTMQGPNGETITVPDTPQMRRRATVQGFALEQETTEQLNQRREAAGSLDEDQYRSSPYYREGVQWDRGMTEDRAAALAEAYDAKRVREHFASKRPITAFIGNLAGQAVDPINYIPFVGPTVKAANVARMGRIAGTAATSALDAAANTAVASGLTYSTRKGFGDDITWQTTVSDIAMSALIGGAFGGVAGAIGRRSDARAAEARRAADMRLSTLKNVQDARIALNDAIDGLARGEDVSLSANAVDAVSRVSREVDQLSRAYDDVRANPTGPVRDPLVEITPEDIEGTIVSRGAFKDINEADLSSRRGWGLVKILWGHGEQSKEAPEFRIEKADVVDLPNVIREYEPSSVSADGRAREWRVERDGRTVVYADSMQTDGRHIVTAYVQRPDRAGADAELSRRRSAVSPGSHPQAGNLVGDTVGDRSIGTPEAGRDGTGSLSEAGNPVQDTTDQPLPSSDRGQSLPARGNIAQTGGLDNSTARPEPIPAGKAEAEARVATPDSYKAMAEQYRVNPDDGSFLEQADIDQIRNEGRLTAEDELVIAEADEAYETGVSYGEALKAVVGCLLT